MTSALRHAPRERVSWNLQGDDIKNNTQRHAPRERVSWNRQRIWWEWKASGHAPRERVSWNALSGLWHSPIPPSRSTWACELKYGNCFPSAPCSRSRSTWACELKWKICFWITWKNSSRSTWACELKFHHLDPCNSCRRHAPRERVSWNANFYNSIGVNAVTLHVSVWVEMWRTATLFKNLLVTLHVSVWVEIC